MADQRPVKVPSNISSSPGRRYAEHVVVCASTKQDTWYYICIVLRTIIRYVDSPTPEDASCKLNVTNRKKMTTGWVFHLHKDPTLLIQQQDTCSIELSENRESIILSRVLSVDVRLEREERRRREGPMD